MMKNTFLFTFLFYCNFVFGQDISFIEIGRYVNGVDGACEISAYDQNSARLFITNAADDALDIVDISNPFSPNLITSVDITLYGGGINSVISLNNGYIATAIEADPKQDPGKVVFLDVDGNYVNEVIVGALPDMLVLTPDATTILVANEGEPDDDYLIDPEGSVSSIDLFWGVPDLSQSDVLTYDFSSAPSVIPGSIQKPGTPFSQDLEPEYIAVDAESKKAAVICQESNAYVVIDLFNQQIQGFKGLGFKDHSLSGNGMDASNKDDIINIQNWNVKGAYQPDAIASFATNSGQFWLSANEGDARDYDGYSSETRIKDLDLDPVQFPNASDLQSDENLGRLKTFTADVIGDSDGDGDVDELYSYGARSFTIWDNFGNPIWDSGDDFEQYIAANHPDFFNCNDGLADEFDDRSDDKGPEPEAIAVGEIDGVTYAFIGLERQGGIMVYDVSDPYEAEFKTFVNNYNNSDGTMTDIAPEGIIFIDAEKSHTGRNMLVVSNEVSGTATIYLIETADFCNGESGSANSLVSNSMTSIQLNDEEENEQLNAETLKSSLEGIESIRVYPNPTTDLLNISFQSMSELNLNLTIYNMVGEKILSNSIVEKDKSSVQLNTSNLNSGIYILSLDNGISTEEILFAIH